MDQAETQHAAAEQERADFAAFMDSVRASDPVWQDKVMTAFTSSVSTRDWALLTESVADGDEDTAPVE